MGRTVISSVRVGSSDLDSYISALWQNLHAILIMSFGTDWKLEPKAGMALIEIGIGVHAYLDSCSSFTFCHWCGNLPWKH